MTAIESRDRVDDRGDILFARGLNGMRLALVELPPGPNPGHAVIQLRLWNALHVAAIRQVIEDDPARAGQIFRIQGGTRVPAGNLDGQVHVVSVVDGGPMRLDLTVAPVGDYSAYQLHLIWDASRIDPFFAQISFRFRPGCFTNDCAPPLPDKPALPGPAIDYLAKDYDSLRHTLMVAMAERVPGWRSTSEADLDQVLIDLLAASADELSDYQDRVMAEATLATARKRVTLARHARLVDYHLHEGNQASTWLALEVAPGQAPFRLDDQTLVAWTGSAKPLPESVFFATREHRLDESERVHFDPLFNELHAHTWREARPALRAGSTSVDLVVSGGGPPEAAALRDHVRSGRLPQLLLAEVLNPLTGQVPGRNPAKRQLLRLIAGSIGPLAAQTLPDPVTGAAVVRVNWREEDALRFDFSFTTFCDGTPVPDISVFHGNLVPVHEGRPMTVVFHERGSTLPSDTDEIKQRHYTRVDRYGDGRVHVLAALPEGTLAYLPTPTGGEVPARSTVHLEVTSPGSATEVWDEVESLVHSDDSSEDGDHFVIETDERRRSTLRFGNGVNGRQIAAGAVVQAQYQIGGGVQGNVGAEQLVFAAPLSGALAGAIVRVWNPFDVVDGREPESADKLRRHAPEAFRSRQLRAVTLADYVRRAEEVDGVSRAMARYAWTGSWRTVRITVDPRGSTTLDEDLRSRVAAHLQAVRLIGEDIELRPPRYVPLNVTVIVCARPEAWVEDLRFVLEQELSDGYTADGRPGLFHPDAWTFGQALHRSVIEGRVQAVAGVEHVVAVVMQRFNAPTPGLPGLAGFELLEMAADEVLLLANEADHLERGLLRLDIRGGRV